MSFEEMPVMACSSGWSGFRCRSSSRARLLGRRASVGSWNKDFDSPVLRASFGGLVVADRRRLALAVGLEAIRLGKEGLEQGRHVLGALNGEMVVGGEADVASVDRRVVGVSDHLDEALFFIERRRDAGRNRLERIEHGGGARIEQDDVADPDS